MNFWYYIFFAALILVIFITPRMAWANVDEAKELIDAGAVLVDVRSPEEFNNGSADGALNIPVGSLSNELKELNWPKDKVILVFCASGARSGMAAKQLKALGYTKVTNLGTVGQARKAVSVKH